MRQDKNWKYNIDDVKSELYKNTLRDKENPCIVNCVRRTIPVLNAETANYLQNIGESIGVVITSGIDRVIITAANPAELKDSISRLGICLYKNTKTKNEQRRRNAIKHNIDFGDTSRKP